MAEINWKYNIGDRIIKCDDCGNIIIDLIVSDREIKTGKVIARREKSGYQTVNRRVYKYDCNICGAKGLIRHEEGLGSHKCLCCAGKIKIPGINTIGDLYPECVKYFRADEAFDPKLTLHSRYDAICPVCKTSKSVPLSSLVKGFFFCDHCHSIANKRPELMKYLVRQEDGELPFGTATMIMVRCPECGRTRNVSVKELTRKGFHCDLCGDSISYPEKFVIGLLKQMNIVFIRQLSSKDFSWCNGYRYDFYIPEYNMIIETHGLQHYYDAFGCLSAIDTQTNDAKKQELAIRNGINKYVVLDCSYSNPDHIKKSILNSEFATIYDMSQINWQFCAEFATKNIIKDVCEYWSNNKGVTVKAIANKFKIDKSTVYDYLKRGTEIGWCDYQPKSSE